jgi:serine acetyltransferase
VKVGKSCYLGSGTTIIGGIEIGDHCLTGIGSVILTDVPQNSVFVGIPAKKLRNTIDLMK